MNKWIKQYQRDYSIFALVISDQKNGSKKVIVCSNEIGARNKPAVKSTTGWFPAPVEISEEQVPEKILKKIEAHRAKVS